MRVEGIAAMPWAPRPSFLAEYSSLLAHLGLTSKRHTSGGGSWPSHRSDAAAGPLGRGSLCTCATVQQIYVLS